MVSQTKSRITKVISKPKIRLRAAIEAARTPEKTHKGIQRFLRIWMAWSPVSESNTLGDILNAGQTYAVRITADTPDSGSIIKTTTVRVQS